MKKQLPKCGETRVVIKYAYFPVTIYYGKPSVKIWLKKYKQLQFYEYEHWYCEGNFLFEDQEGIDATIKELKDYGRY